jgi:hypothetical protein
MIPERYAPQTYALMRVVFGFVFLISVGKVGILCHTARQARRPRLSRGTSQVVRRCRSSR